MTYAESHGFEFEEAGSLRGRNVLQATILKKAWPSNAAGRAG